MVDGLYDQGKPVGPVIASPSQQLDGHGIAERHQTVAVVFDLMNPVGAVRGLVGWAGEAGLSVIKVFETASRANEGRLWLVWLMTLRGSPSVLQAA